MIRFILVIFLTCTSPALAGTEEKTEIIHSNVTWCLADYSNDAGEPDEAAMHAALERDLEQVRNETIGDFTVTDVTWRKRAYFECADLWGFEFLYTEIREK